MSLISAETKQAHSCSQAVKSTRRHAHKLLMCFISAATKQMRSCSQAVHVQVADLVKEVCRVLKKDDSAAMPDTYLTALQNAFQRHLSDDQSRQSLQDFITMCTRVAQMYAGFNASATALLHIAKVAHWSHPPQSCLECLGVVGTLTSQLCSLALTASTNLRVCVCVSDV